MVSATTTLVLLALHNSLQPSRGYVISPTFVTKHPPKFQRKLSLIHSSKDESVSLAFDDQTATFAAAESFNVTLTDPSNFVQQSGESTDGSSFLSRNKIAIIAGVAALLVLSQLPQMTTFLTLVITNYSRVLHDYPLPTKSLTAGALCGVSDVIAQYRDSSRKEFNFRRWIRFAGKGCVGGIIWSFWYDELDIFLDETNSFSFFNIFGIVTDQWTKSYLGIVKTTLSILIEQFLWCPIVFGTFEIPVSTILNGGGLSSVKKEVDSKLGDLLISNAKIWTFANILIYGPVPVAWRPVISNCVDIIWQSIVSSVSADCGKVEDDICTVVGDDTFENIVTMSNDFATPDASVADDTSAMNDAEKDLAFYAEKSRF